MSELKQGSGKYSPELTAQIRKAKVVDVLTAQTRLLERNPQKTDLHDLEAVKAVTSRYIETCKEIGFCPNVETLCAQLGIGRSWFYKYVKENPEDPTAQFLNRIRLAWAGARVSLAEAGAIDNSMSIFYLKNSGLNFSDKHEIEVDMETKETRPTWALGMDEETYAKKLIESLPEPDP